MGAEDLESMMAQGGDVNPLKSDSELKALLMKLDKVKKYKTFQRWKKKFLDRLEQYLYESGMKPAEKSCNDFDTLLKAFVKSASKVAAHIEKGELSSEKKTVKASLALNEMCNSLVKVVSDTETLIPASKKEEKKKKFNKFHLGAALIRQGFHQYATMQAIEDVLKDLGEKLGEVADKQQHESFEAFSTQVQRFCDVMADLQLYKVMIKCLEFANEPEEEESSDEEDIRIEIEVETPEGQKKRIKLELDPNERIGNIKEAIAGDVGIAPDKQIMKFQGKVLDDDKATLKKVGIDNGAKLTVEPFRIPVKVRNYDGQVIDVKIDPVTYLSDLKIMLEDQAKIPAKNQKLFLQGKELDNNFLKCEDYGIKAGTVLDLEPKLISVNVQMPMGQVHTIDISPTDDSLETLKAKIADETGMAAPRQVLSFDGKALPAAKSVKDMGITDGSTINVQVFKVPVTINTHDGKSIKMMVDPNSYLSDVKIQLEKEGCGVPARNQRLSMAGQELDQDHLKAADYGIKEGSVLDLEPKSITVTVDMPNGQKVDIAISPSDTAQSLKAKIADETGMDVPRQVLKFNGTELPNGKALKEMGIGEGSNIKVEVFRVPVTVNTYDGKQVPVMVDPASPLADLKRQLQKDTDVPAENQKISLNGQELADDNKNAGDYGIKDGTVLDMEPKSIMITVDTPDGRQHQVEISPTDTTDAMKAKIAKATGMAAPRQVLKFNGKEIPKGKRAKDVGIQDGSNIKVEVFRVPVTVNTYDGKKVSVLVDPASPLADLKRQLQKDTNVPAENQKIFLNGQELADDNKNAGDYGIQDGTVLDMEPRTIMIAVDTPDGRQHQVEISPSDTTDAMKAKIAKATGMAAPRQVLKFNGKEIPNGRRAKDVGIQDGSNIKIEIFRVPVTVKTMDGAIIKVMVDPSDTVLAIKKQLESESGLAAKNQKLFMNGTELADDNKSAGDYGIKEGSELDLEPKAMQVSVEMPDGKKLNVEISPIDTTEAIKAKIADKTGMAAPRQVLKVNGKELGKGKRAKDMGIDDGQTIKVEIFKVPVTVDTMDGRRINVMVDPTAPLGELKRELENESGLAPTNQRLYMNGEELPDDRKSAADCGIKAGSHLDLEPKIIKISVDLPDGKKHTVNVKPSDTSQSIKAKIAEETGLAAPRQVLKYQGRELPEDRTVKSLGIKEGDNLGVEIFKIPITVNTYDGHTLDLRIEPSGSIDAIKKVLREPTGLEPKKQCLKLDGEELSNGRRSAEEYGIKPRTVLFLEPHADPIIFVDVKAGTLFGVERDLVIQKSALSMHQNNRLDFLEAAKDSAAKEHIMNAMMASPRLGFATQVVVEKLDVEDYDLAEAEKVKNVWGVNLKKREKNKKGEELIFVDPKTGACGELSRTKYIDMKFITPVSTLKGESLQEAEKDTQKYDKYISDIRSVFGIKSAT